MLKASRSVAIAASLTICGTGTLQNAVANGDTRSLTFTNAHTGESGTFTFKREGRYDPEVLTKLNWILRDWRKEEPTEMDPHLFDVIWEVYRDVGATAPITILCGYRSPSTNAMLRARSKAVAETSQHMRGKAMDFYIPGVQLSELRAAGLRLQRGGVGFYPSSNFVHMDTGGVRMWPRMSYDELARLFPDGKTVLVPSNGKPLPGYQQALAELESRGNTAADVPQSDGLKGIRNFFASLFSKPAPEESDAGEEEGVRPARASRQTQVASAAPAAKPAPAPEPQPAKPVVTAVSTTPLPSARPAQIAAATMLTAQAVNAPLAPLPIKRPQAPAQQVASLQTAGAPVPLPAVIMRGTSEQPVGPAAALGYAAAGDVVGSLPSNTFVSATPQPKLRTAGRMAEIPFGRLFRAPGLTGEAYLKMPETRVFTAFVTAPREVVAAGFGSDPMGGLSTAHFSGEAIVSLPTYVFQPQAVRVSQRMP
ncbi:DUF882 domain-containing protein [Azorhizobium doebereinerae]|uniref:DUF882 domain-containing protein n=1 Tax=Azorhizobium doebereinerae TaxID=281091 RepID=UPI00041BB49B|nr:DUF882 domain-containing protein [Azorhizobium doebereinerae]